jgi:hypothetical protein
MKKVLTLALVALSPIVFAEAPPQKIQLPAQSKLIDDVVVPVPSEIFGVLDKLGPRPNWTAVQRPSKNVAGSIGDQPQNALLLGAVIAEGFIAVEAEDAEEVKQIGKSVLNLAKVFNVQKSVVKRSNSIIDSADKKDWRSVRRELDGALEDVKNAMVELNSEPLSQLISLGGWLRGTEALTAVVQKSYSKDGAELLHQPLLLDHFEKRLAGLKPKFKADPVVTKIQKGLVDIRPLIGLTEGSDISEKSVQEINAITSELIKSIHSKAQ